MMRALMVAAALAVWSGSALAQASTPEDLDRLKRMLDERLPQAPRTRGISKGERPLRTDDFYAIRRRDQEQGNPGAAPGKRSSSDLPALIGIAAAAAGEGDGAPAAAAAPRGSQRVQARRDSYVIVLKTDLNGQQLDEALATLSQKYNLEITRANKLGEIRVSPRQPATRGIEPGAASQSLGAALEPKIIKELRNEPFVDAAYVDFLVTPKSLPRRTDTRVQAGGNTYSWTWRTGELSDGNWGLKMMRMPPVWSILNRVRKIDPDRPRTRMAFLDVGFGTHAHISYNAVFGGMPANPPKAECTYSHGTHVAGIAGALFGKGRGIDGMVPDSKIDAIPVSSEVWLEGTNLGLTNQLIQRAMLFSGAIDSLVDFLDQNPLKPGEKRVVNASLGYNWSALGFEFGKDQEEDENVKAHIFNSARSVQRLAAKYKDSILIVAAAGNDSDGLADPHWAEFASPFGFAATHESPTYQKSKNVLIVEALGRDGKRAAFSNAGGHVAAPGVDIMSTLAGVSDGYGLCSGTSQATPHVTALAAILFELDPKKSPAEIAEVIRSSAQAGSEGKTPRVDALAAVFKLSPDNIKYLVDLNGDGKVDSVDLEIIKTHLLVLDDARRNGTPIGIDLNGDGDINENEACWPLIDFVGAGRALYFDPPGQAVAASARSDLEMLEAAWTDPLKAFKTALAEVGLEQLLAQWRTTQGSSALVASVPAAPRADAAGPVTASSASAGACR
jgi:Subtilase family/Dockerin type I domain